MFMADNKLAIDGAAPTVSESIPSWPIDDPEVGRSIVAAIESGAWGRYEAEYTERLAQRLADMFSAQHCLLCCSGTIAVELALRGLGVSADDEVILGGYDFPGNFRAIEAIGAFPVLVDLVRDGWVIDPEEVESAVTPKTRAIIVSHLHGQLADIEAVREICEPRGIGLVEDACQVPGASLNGVPVGSFGDVAALSFGGSKLLTSGRGGALLTNSSDIYQRARIFNSRGNEAFPLSQLQAAALLPQLDRLDERNGLRNRNAERLIDATRDNPLLRPLGQCVSATSLHTAYYKLPWLLDDINTDWTRPDFLRAIQLEGVPIDMGFRGFTRRTARRCRATGPLLNSRVAAQQTVLLHHPALLGGDRLIDQIIEALAKFVR